jgi:hypothetical protein
MKINKSTAKQIVGKVENPDCDWIARWLENWCRSNSYPLTMISNNFMTDLGRLLEVKTALSMLESIRQEYKQTHPFETVKETDFDFLNSL